MPELTPPPTPTASMYQEQTSWVPTAVPLVLDMLEQGEKEPCPGWAQLDSAGRRAAVYEALERAAVNARELKAAALAPPTTAARPTAQEFGAQLLAACDEEERLPQLDQIAILVASLNEPLPGVSEYRELMGRAPHQLANLERVPVLPAHSA
ncbi:hypothetical protein H9P43_000902 [Blastocladiella emersonii ATCC 22665]|nr:hypothetical protein H9P43_000902 [Blastocladiella emersonii ATCC 22665]